MGVAGFLLSLVGFGVPLLGVIGLVLSIIGYRQAKHHGMARGLSMAGIVLGILATAVLIFVVFLGLHYGVHA